MMIDEEDKEQKSEKLRKEGEKSVNRLILVGAIVLLLTVIIIGFLIHNSITYK